MRGRRASVRVVRGGPPGRVERPVGGLGDPPRRVCDGRGQDQPGPGAAPPAGWQEAHVAGWSRVKASAAAMTARVRSVRMAVRGVSSSNSGFAAMNQARAT